MNSGGRDAGQEDAFGQATAHLRSVEAQGALEVVSGAHRERTGEEGPEEEVTDQAQAPVEEALMWHRLSSHARLGFLCMLLLIAVALLLPVVILLWA
jgi:hypothetical protein